MNSQIQILKQTLRARLRARIEALSAGEKLDASVRACALLERQAVWKKASAILFYSPLPSELNIQSLMFRALEAGKIVTLPRFIPESSSYSAFRLMDLAEDCHPGKFGIHEPKAGCPAVPLNQLDLVLVPGVGFDAAGRRLGRGRGFYDRLLPDISGVKCGIAFDEQVLDEIPAEPHDIRLDCILTPARWHEVTG